jgi:hypothetical protein
MRDRLLGVLTIALTAVFGWVWQTQNRITVIETKEIGLKELLTSEFEDVRDRLKRIENAIDRH